MCWEKPRQATLAPCGHHALCVASSVLLETLIAVPHLLQSVRVCSVCADSPNNCMWCTLSYAWRGFMLQIPGRVCELPQSGTQVMPSPSQ